MELREKQITVDRLEMGEIRQADQCMPTATAH